MKRLMIFAIAAVGAILASCSKSDLQTPDLGKPNALPVHVTLGPEMLSQSFGPVSQASQTKVSAKEDEEALVVRFGGADTKSTTELAKADDSKIYNVWAIQFDKTGKLIGVPYYVGGSDMPVAGAGGTGVDATYSLSVNLTTYSDTGGKIYFIANTNSPTFFNTTNAATETALKAVVKNIGTELKPTAAGGIPMLGVVTGKAVTSSASIGTVSLKRLMAKVILKYKVNSAFTGFEVTGVRLRNAAANIYFAPEPTGIFPAKATGSHIDYPAEVLTSAATDGDYKKFVWYVPENWRNVISGITADGDRVLSKTDGNATYIEIKGTLKSAAKCEKAVYNILLGDPTSNKGDFNVKRNNIYTVTVDIQGTNTADKRITVESFDMNNSAIVTPNGGSVTFDIRKLTKGWQTTMPALGTSAALRAEVLWSDVANVIKPADITLDKVNGLLTVKSSQATVGNAVVALYNNASSGGDILWSWHIWVTDYNPDGSKAYGLGANSKASVTGGQVHTYGTQFVAKNPGKVIMDRNLGATKAYYDKPGAGDATADQAFGMFYQWGRKDPFPRVLGSSINANDATGTTIPIYGKDGTKLADEVTDAAGTGYRKIKIASAMSGTNTLAYSVKNPLAFIYNGSTPYDWYTNVAANQNNNLWGDGAAKSAYDPCPKGWRIAPNGTWSDFTRDATTPLNGTFPYFVKGAAKENGTTGDYHMTNGRLYKVSTSGAGTPLAWYPAPGFRDSGWNGKNGALMSVGNSGYYWASGVDGTNGRGLGFYSTWLDTGYSNGRAYGFSVRCLQE